MQDESIKNATKDITELFKPLPSQNYQAVKNHPQSIAPMPVNIVPQSIALSVSAQLTQEDSPVDDEVDGFMKQIRALMRQMPGKKRSQFAIYTLTKAQEMLYARDISDPLL